MPFPSVPCIDMLPNLELTGKISFKQIERENQLTKDLRGRNVLVTGGTNGIGAAIMLAFAKRGANIHIAGRNAEAASALLFKAKAVSMYSDASQTFEFHSFDASSIADCKRFAEEMLKTFGTAPSGLDYLVMTQGGIGNGERKETKEGHEWFLALHDFSRYIIAAMLLPVLKQGPRRGIVIDVLSAGVWNKFDDENLELNGKSIDFFHMSSRDGPIHDIMTQEFNQRCPEVIYNHVYPGPTKTNMNSTGQSNFILKMGFAVATQVIGQTAEHYAEIAYNIATNWEVGRMPAEECRTWGTSGERVSIREYPKRPEVREKVWSFLERETGVVLSQ